LSYQWQFNEADLPSEVNPTLVLSNVTAANAGNYRVIAATSFGRATSAVARVMVGGRVREIFGTGVDDDHLLLPGGRVDPHYQLAFSDDPGFPGPAAIILREAAPISALFPKRSRLKVDWAALEHRGLSRQRGRHLRVSC